jgi:hypothetical protein
LERGTDFSGEFCPQFSRLFGHLRQGMDANRTREAGQWLLTEGRTLGEVQLARDPANAAHPSSKEHDVGMEAVNHATEVMLEARRKLGEILHAGPKHMGNCLSHVERTEPRRLADVGLTRLGSHAASRPRC